MGDDTKNPFDYQTPSPLQTELMSQVREKTKELHALLVQSIPMVREKSLAITKLEEMSMWANKAIMQIGNTTGTGA